MDDNGMGFVLHWIIRNSGQDRRSGKHRTYGLDAVRLPAIGGIWPHSY
jgi:hypothetical protein